MLQRLLAIVRKELITMLRDPRAPGADHPAHHPAVHLFVRRHHGGEEHRSAVVTSTAGPYAADVQQRLAGSRSFTRLPRYAKRRSRPPAHSSASRSSILVLPSGFSADRAAGRPASARNCCSTAAVPTRRRSPRSM